MAPSRSTPQMMQVTRTAFQASANLNKQATDPKSHTLVGNFYTRFSPVPATCNLDGRPWLDFRPRGRTREAKMAVGNKLASCIL